MSSPRGEGQYFTERPEVTSKPRMISVRLADLDLDLVTDRGVFAVNAVDPGTRFLLEEAPSPPATGTIVDLGCGYGAIAVALAKRSPAADVVAIDVNRRALALCAANAERNGVQVRVAHADDVGPDLEITALYSNPPVRIGKQALHDLLLRWLGRLDPGSSAYLVVLRHLGADTLTTWLSDSGFPTERLRSRRGYRILQVQPAQPSPHDR
ncbi:MAG: class I SAM-dependent methyltransferase [Candidatus Dormibacteria bacterium]